MSVIDNFDRACGWTDAGNGVATEQRSLDLEPSKGEKVVRVRVFRQKGKTQTFHVPAAAWVIAVI